MKTPYIILLCIVIAGGSFYGGMQFQKTRKTATNTMQFGANGQFRINANGMARGTGAGQIARTGMKAGVNFTAGEVLSLDSKSLTVKLPDGGSKLVFISASTTIQKTTDGSIADVKAGSNVMVNGEANQDGSLTAKSIQLRTDVPMPPQGEMPQGQEPTPNK